MLWDFPLVMCVCVMVIFRVHLQIKKQHGKLPELGKDGESNAIFHRAFGC